MRIARLFLPFVFAFLAGCASMQSPASIAMEEFMVPSEPGIDLYVRNKHAAGRSDYSGDKIVLFVHGATYPAETAFDLQLNGLSWMDYIVRHGYDVYLVDVRGYGRSTRPPQMDQPAERNEPFAGSATAVKDVAAAVDFIRKRRGVDKINLLGWSWGTTIMGWYTAQNNDKVNKLVLYAPQWIRNTAALTDSGGKIGAYRLVSMDSAKARWLTGVPEAKKADLIPPGWFEAWAAATIATDPVGGKMNPPMLRAPNGVVQDGRDYWGAGKAVYDPGLIRVPTFLAHAEWDADLPSYMLYAYFDKLTNVPYKRYVQIGEGTHTVIMEKNRMQLFRAVQQFLDERLEPGR
ncbi:alpha/beta hydrolase [Ramlibacter sp. XY19]|uniref:alpha/beta hydrolase n=1 Tax=Ramlibacter paludis TaxID=2908000 RepID=UPI0023DAEB84|nr:alpha/beta fold hydrolase [Ramlibacter paludis]MCG2594257.1 alpha/beta hydrolase [Ramlibacter paludis]